MNKLGRILINICRLVLALTLIFSGFVKAIDPMGTNYKLQDYLGALSLQGQIPEWLTVTAAVALAAVEFCLGLFLLFAIHRRTVTRLILCLMVVMTALSAWLWWCNPISDCGCFGDAIVLTNGETFAKNIVLLAAAIIVCKWPLMMVRFISRTNQWIVINYSILFIIFTSLYCLYDLPIFDFRPYKEGADLRKGMEIPETAEQPQFETIFILEKDGKRQEFTLENYPDSTWAFVDRKTIQTSEGYVPPIHDFSIETVEDGEDITEDVIADPGYTFLLISPQLETANDSEFGTFDQLYEYCQEQNYPFYCLTSSGEKGIERWRDLTGAEYPFCHTDATTLKTIIRSNPGLLLLHDGKVVRKWSYNMLPDITMLTTRLEDSPIGQTPSDTPTKKLLRILSVFVLPLLALSLADRLWAWTRWVRRKERKKKKEEKEEK